MTDITIRHIHEADNSALAVIIRKTLEEFGANLPGTVYYDATTDHLSDVFTVPGSVYFVAEKDGEVLGGGGIYPTAGLPADTCELVKLYLSPTARGLGLGKKLMAHCLQAAATHGFTKVYLETMPELTNAIPLYKKFGFKNLDAPMGNTGHHGCAVWMLNDAVVDVDGGGF